jgi:hypothetical protein
LEKSADQRPKNITALAFARAWVICGDVGQWARVRKDSQIKTTRVVSF